MLLEIKDLAVEVAGKRVLKNINLSIDEGETHVLLGPNGAGKSTLFLTILGFPQYKVVNGSIKFKGQEITNLTTAERVHLGLGVSFQNPPSIRGVSVKDLLKIISNQDMDEELNSRMKELSDQLKFNDEFLDRDVNYGFSGGEVKRSEILQLLAQMPDFTMFDEPDSGVDIENVELIASEIRTLLDKDKKQINKKRSGLLITHLGYILNFVNADKAHVLIEGVISCSGNPNEIIEADTKPMTDALIDAAGAGSVDCVVIAGSAHAQATVVRAIEGTGTALPIILTPQARSSAFPAALVEAGGSLNANMTTVGVADSDPAALNTRQRDRKSVV